MRVFETQDCVPDNFTGTCRIEEEECVITFKNGMYHSDFTPCFIYDSGEEEWWQNGLIHRLDGPAFNELVVTHVGRFFISGKGYAEKEYWSHPFVVEHKLNKILNHE